MPKDNRFRHQTYTRRGNSVFSIIEHPLTSKAEIEESAQHQRYAIGRRLREVGVRSVYLIHGTFVGSDPLGWIRTLSRVWPQARQVLSDLQTRGLDSFAKYAGNYTEEYAEQLSAAINSETHPEIPVKLFQWTGENNHLARAEAAVRLVAELHQRHARDRGRVLLWGHSHGGNVLALLTNLLGCDVESREAFFHAVRSLWSGPTSSASDPSIWNEVWNIFQSKHPPLENIECDIASFGVPVRYGWEGRGFSQLLHFVNHRALNKEDDLTVPLPSSSEEIHSSLRGDFVQAFGIAGTNLAPGLLDWRTHIADWRLHRFLQAKIRSRDVLANLKSGTRLHEDGETLLVDYGTLNAAIPIFDAHAVYTREQWLKFHLHEVVERFYGL
ncbi:MAG: hypothetical protein MK165_08540 [Pirellulaceae bacterium]|nr:hypothetical protein [Pirellulaceae bacterium]